MAVQTVLSIAALVALAGVSVAATSEVPAKNFTALVEGISPADFATIGDKKYYISTSSVGYQDANDAMLLCTELGMKLLSLETEEEANLVAFYLATNGKTDLYFTSGKRSEGTFEWTSLGRNFEYSNWAIGEPDFTTGDACMYMSREMWYDIDCAYTRYFICEEKIAC